MLHATVRNRKIYVKSPLTIPKGSKNVDKVLFDLDDEWKGFAITCVFKNEYATEVTKAKQIETETITVEVFRQVNTDTDGDGKNDTMEDELKSSKVTTKTTESEVELKTENDENKADGYKETSKNTVIEKDAGTGETYTVTTKETETKFEQPVTSYEDAYVAKEVDVYDGVAMVPCECLDNAGRLSASLIGTRIIAGANSNETDRVETITTMKADSYWDVVESGDSEGDNPGEATPTLVDRIVTAALDARVSAQAAQAAADAVVRRAEAGEFNGRDGNTPTVSVGRVLTSEPGAGAVVSSVPTATGISLIFTLPQGAPGPRGEQGVRGPQGERGPMGESYVLTDDDRTELVDRVLDALPNGDEVMY